MTDLPPCLASAPGRAAPWSLPMPGLDDAEGERLPASLPPVVDAHVHLFPDHKPLVVHAGREPASPAYKCDPHALCSADRVETALRAYPSLKLCVPHLGADEYAAYERLLTTYDNLWLDTTMAIAEFFRGPSPTRLVQARPERVLYATDFPNVPYAWDREVRKLIAIGLREPELAAVLGGTPEALFGGA